jgi:hypothetical protein
VHLPRHHDFVTAQVLDNVPIDRAGPRGSPAGWDSPDLGIGRCDGGG